MRRLLPALLLLLAVVAVPGASAEQPVLDRPQRGPEAVQALGEQLAAVARENDTTPAELRERFLNDPSLWVDEQGRLFYVDPAPDRVEEAEVVASAATAPQTREAVLALHSRPGAKRTVMLDVDGVGGPWGGSIGSAWSRSYTGGDGVAEPYDRDGDPAVMGTGEIAEIYSIWQRVAEDFAPFDVNVTTQEPGLAAIERSGSGDDVYGTRVAITSSSTGCGCGGVAYVGVFDLTSNHSAYQPAFVYNEGAKAAAEAASHEAGHNLGLSHDGTASVGYYEGHGDWAPIMGVGYYEPISQWSKGEYSGANNGEDDFIVAEANGAPLRTDDHGVGASATPAGSDGASGTIERASDVDELSLTLTSDATVTFDVAPASVSPNLDLRATLIRDGVSLVVADPLSAATSTDLAAGLGASITADLTAGTYTLSIEGVGARDPATTGYSDYGSLGAWTLSISGGTWTEVVTPPQPPAEPKAEVPTDVTASVAGSLVTVSWTQAGPVTGYEVQREKYAKGRWGSTELLTPTGTATSYTHSSGPGTFRYRVQALNQTAASGWSAWSNSVVVEGSGKPNRK